MISEIQDELVSQGFKIIDKIGEGGFGQVYTTNWDLYPSETFVLKIINVENQKQLSTVRNEIESLGLLDNVNIIKMFKHFIIRNNYFLVLEYGANGTLERYVKEKGKLTYDSFCVMASQCLSALNECHSKGLAHLDIKPSNILLDKYYRIKICDFGFAKISKKGEKIINTSGSKYFCSPERLMGRKFEPMAADIWSLGITFYYMITGYYPWQFETIKDPETWVNKMDNICYPDGCNDKIIRLISQMLSVDPKNRTTGPKIKKNSIFNQFVLSTSRSMSSKKIQCEAASKIAFGRPRNNSLMRLNINSNQSVSMSSSRQNINNRRKTFLN